MSDILHNFTSLYIIVDPTNLKTVYYPPAVIPASYDGFSGVNVLTIGYYTASGDTESFISEKENTNLKITTTYITKGGSNSTIPTEAGKHDFLIEVSLKPNPLTPSDPNSEMIGSFTSKWDSANPNKTDLYIVDPSKAIYIDKAIATVNLVDTTHTYDGLSPTATYTTNPPDLKCRVTYGDSGALVSPSDSGSSFKVAATVSDKNYKVAMPAIAQHNIVMDTAAMAQSFNTKSGLLSPEGNASLVHPSGFITATLLTRLDIPQINVMSTISSLESCAKSLPEKLIIAIATKAITMILNNIPGLGIANHIKQIIEMLEEAQAIMKLLQDIRNNPLGFLDEVLAASGVYDNINDQIHALESKFPAIPGGVAEVLKNINDICNLQDYSSLGLPSSGRLKSDPTKIPVAVTPTPMPTFNPASNNAKMDYDGFLDGLKEAIAKDIPKMEDLKKLEKEGDPKPLSDYKSMITAVTTVIYSFHDDIKITTDSSKDKSLQQKYIDNALRIEKSHTEWAKDLIADFLRRTIRGKIEIVKNVDVIRAYFMKNVLTPPGGALIGATVYGPGKQTGGWDPSTTSENAADPKAAPDYDGTKDGDKGAYGLMLSSDFTIASTRWPGGSIIELKNPDGTPYNPSGINSAGLYTVADVGAYKGTGTGSNTFHHPDIFTTNPAPYGGPNGNEALANVRATVYSIGSQTKNPKYIGAHKLYASELTATNGATTNA